MGANPEKKRCFEFLMSQFLYKDIDPYNVLRTVPMLLWCPDALHGQKLQKYKVLNNLLSLSFRLDGNYINIDEISKLFPFCDKVLYRKEK